MPRVKPLPALSAVVGRCRGWPNPVVGFPIGVDLSVGAFGANRGGSPAVRVFCGRCCAGGLGVVIPLGTDGKTFNPFMVRGTTNSVRLGAFELREKEEREVTRGGDRVDILQPMGGSMSCEKGYRT